MRLPSPEGLPKPQVYMPPVRPRAETPVDGTLNLVQLQNELGLGRSPQSLGFDQASFDGCRWNVRGGGERGACGPRFLSVVHFRLLCRDSVGTVQTVATNFTPLTKRMQWRLAGVQGETRTDAEGFGQVQMVSSRPTKGQRFILIIGTKSLGLEVGEVTQIILPGNWCGRLAKTEGGIWKFAELDGDAG